MVVAVAAVAVAVVAVAVLVLALVVVVVGGGALPGGGADAPDGPGLEQPARRSTVASRSRPSSGCVLQMWVR